MKKWLYVLLGIALVGGANAGLLSINHRNAAGSSSGSNFPLGALALDGFATPEQVALVLPVTGTLTTSATATCEYRRTVDSSYSTCHPLFRVRPSFAETSPGPPTTVSDVFAWPEIDLAQGTSYDFRITVSDGVNSDVKTLTTTTRALPAACGAMTVTILSGSSVSTIQTAINAAAAGAVVEFQDATYALSSTLTITNSNGTSASPICIRGGSRTGTILSRSSGSVISFAAGDDNINLERMTLAGSGIDSGTGASSTGISFSSSGATQDRITIRDVAMTGVDRGIVGAGEVDEILVYNNTLTGNNAWTQDFYAQNGSGAPGAGDGTPDVQQNVFWNDDGIGIVGQGNAAFNNTLRAFGDVFTLSVGTSTDNADEPVTKGVFFYRNDVTLGGDDLIEADYGYRNIAFYDNRAKNVATFLSLDKLYGGPLVFARNIALNITRTPFKLNGQNTGQFILNNTFVQTAHIGAAGDISAWYQPDNGAQRSWGFQNNVSVYRGAGTRSPWLESATNDPIDFSYNAWYPNTGNAMYGNNYANIAAAQAISGKTPVFATTQPFDNDVAVLIAPFNETITLGATASTELTTATTPTIASGSTAKNAGVVIAGITDGFSGAAPDMGAVISGRTVVSYGDPSGGSMAYIASMADYAVAAQSAVANGNTTISSVTPSEWKNGGGGGSGLVDDQGLSAIMHYSGGGKATTGRKLFIHGGGHNDSPNNGMYVDDFDGTTMPTGWGAPVISAVSAVGGTDPYSDGKPDSVHTYDDMVTLNGYVYRFQGSRYNSGSASGLYWRYNIATGAWTQLANNSNVYQYCTNRGSTIADPATNKIFFMMADSCGNYFYNATANTWSSSKSLSFAPIEYMTGVKGPGNEAIFIGHSQKTKFTINWSTETVSDTAYTTSGSSGLYATDGPSAAYDSVRGVYWMWGGASGSAGWSNIYELNLATGVTTAHALSGTIPGGSRTNGSWGGFVFSDTDRFIGVANDVAGSSYVIKLPPN